MRAHEYVGISHYLTHTNTNAQAHAHTSVTCAFFSGAKIFDQFLEYFLSEHEVVADVRELLNRCEIVLLVCGNFRKRVSLFSEE